jgi:hypothetical protein
VGVVLKGYVMNLFTFNKYPLLSTFVKIELTALAIVVVLFLIVAGLALAPLRLLALGIDVSFNAALPHVKSALQYRPPFKRGRS